MRETSYHAVIAEMTVRALWELQNLLDCIPDALWDRCYGGAPLWQHVYHTLHELDQWFINPRDTDFVEPPIHTPHLQELHIYPAVRLDRGAVDDYFYTIKAKLSIYLTSLHDEDLLQRPDNCEWTRFTLILSQYRHLYRHMGMVMGFLEAETGLCPRTLEVGEDPPAAPDLTPVWQRDLPASGVHIELANAQLLSDADVYYAATREELYVHNVSVLPAVKADGQPVVTFYGAAAQDIDLVYLEDIGDVYVDYDRVKPQIKLDYILTEGDGYVSYELDTAYNFEFTVTTQTGEDKILVVSERSDVK